MKKLLVLFCATVMATGFMYSCDDNSMVTRYLFDSNNPNITSLMKSGKNAELVSFAHMSDVHVANQDDPIRLENLKLMVGADSSKYLDLGSMLSSISGVERGYEAYSRDIELATLRSINARNGKSQMDFAIATGDITDTSIEPEYIAAIENLSVLDIPWFVSIGNHDVEYEGTFKSEILIEAILLNAVGVDTSELESKDKIIDYLSSVPSFQDSAEQMQENGYGNYTFDPQPFVHCIVLFDTDVYNPDVFADNFNLSNGLITKKSFSWALKEIDNNKDKLCVIFAHHPLSSYFPTTALNPWLENGVNMKLALKSRHNFVAWVCGHTHDNLVEPVPTLDGWGFWSITTCSLIDYPSEWRQLSIRDQGNGIGVITSNMFERKKVLGTDGTDIADLQESICSDTDAAYGDEGDRNVELYFKMPPDVAQNIKANY